MRQQGASYIMYYTGSPRLLTRPPQPMAEGTGSVSTSLSGVILEKAIRELNEPEHEGQRIQLITELRRRLKTWEPREKHEEGVTLSRLDDDKFLLRFLRAKKFDLNRAEQLYINYHTFRHKHASLLGEISPQAAEGVFQAGIVTVLPHRTKDGCRVIVLRPSKWDIEAIPPGQIMKTALVILDKLLEEEETQVHGVAMFESLDGFSLTQAMHLARSDQLRKGLIMELLQEAFPARFKGIHLINQPWYISIILTIIMPFMKQKLRDRIHLHGAEFSTLHDYLPAEHLPAEFGGQLPSLDSYNARLLFQEPSHSQ